MCDLGMCAVMVCKRRTLFEAHSGKQAGMSGGFTE